MALTVGSKPLKIGGELHMLLWFRWWRVSWVKKVFV